MQLLILLLLITAIAAMQMLKGGWEHLASLPAYAVLAVAGVASVWPLRPIELPRRTLLPLLSTAAFFGYVIVRALLSPVAYLARADLNIAIGAPILYLLIVFCVTSPRLRAWLVAALLVLGFANGIVGAIQYFKGENFMLFSMFPRANYGTRASGFFGNPNQLAGFLEVAILLGVSLAWWGRWKLWGRIVAGYGAVMCACGLVLSVSRGGYASLLAGLFVFVLLSLTARERKTRSNLWVIVLAVVVLLGALAFTVFTVVKDNELVQARVSATNNDVPFRASLWQAALKQFTHNPAFGTGSATYLYYGRLYRAPVVQSDPIYAHNDYVQLLGEYGAIGFLLFLAFLGAHLRAGWQAILELLRHLRGSRLAAGSNSLALTIGALSCVSAYLIHSLVDFNLHIPANALVMALVFGLLANPGSIPASAKTGEHTPTATLPMAARLAAPALSVWMLWIVVARLPAAYHAHRAERILSNWMYLEKAEVAKEAEKFARLGLERDPNNADLLRTLGETQVAFGIHTRHLPEERERYYREAVETYRKALTLAPMDRNLVLALAWSLDDMKSYAEAGELFKRALALDPNSGQVLSAYGNHLEMQGRTAEAQELYKLAAERGTMSAVFQLEKLKQAPKAPRTGLEDDIPKLGR